MPTATNDGVSIHYEREGTGEPVVFVPEAGLGGWLWGWQHAALAGPYETVVWDLRGTGRSDAPPGPYDLPTLADDLLAVLEACEIRTAHLVGCGLGGALALETARRSTRVETLAPFGAAPAGEAFDLEALFAPPGDRAAIRESLGVALSAEFRRDQPDAVEGIADWRAEGDAGREGWEAQLGALAGFDATDWLVEITCPALVGAGTDDQLVEPEATRELAEGLPRGEYVAWEGAGHFPFIERSREVNDRLAGFLDEHGTGE